MSDVQSVVKYLLSYSGKPVKIMEVCGTHTSTAVKGGLRTLVSPSIRLVSGPGCPVCLAASAYIDRLCVLAGKEDYIVASFGDLFKVKGSSSSLADAKAHGGNVVMVYSPLDALKLAEDDPTKTIVMAAVGFETTVPAYALMLQTAIEQHIDNIRLLTALKVMPPALEQLCADESIDAFIAPGHVAAIIGSKAFEPIASRFHRPFAVAGFTPESMLYAMASLVNDIQNGDTGVKNLYGEVVRPEGNRKALSVIEDYFETDNASWRGLSVIAGSGLYLKEEYARFDAGSRGLDDVAAGKRGCRCADVLTGKLDPGGCSLFGFACTPENAIGPCMVSAEGACGIWYREGMR